MYQNEHNHNFFQIQTKMSKPEPKLLEDMEIPQIKKLDENVINRIAAGEVIQRPANALKELLENSLDAKATNIQVTVKNGGLKLLQIQDNGVGIRKDDFGIVCERFTTSKLREFEDLYKICTFGFRGEALASISHVAHLTIISKTMMDVCAYQASFVDGLLQCDPKPVAGNQGTLIIVEDLFYNMVVRRKALRSPAEEYQKVSDIIGKYAVHNASVGFAFKKSGENNDIRTPQNSSHVENISIVYGSTIAKTLVEFSLENKTYKFKVKSYITNLNYKSKKFVLILFINNRLVDCQGLKKCIQHVYSYYLPKNTHPFVYMSLELDPSDLDVNVHPTKHEVHFLNEEKIVEIITSALEAELMKSNDSRAAFTQIKLPQVFGQETVTEKNDTTKSIRSNDFVRTDAKEQKIGKFFGEIKKPDFDIKKTKNVNDSLTEEEFQKHHELFLNRIEELENKISEENVQIDVAKQNISESGPDGEGCSKQPQAIKELNVIEKKSDESITDWSKIVPRNETKLTSVLTLRKAIEENCHRGLREAFSQHVFVGCASSTQALIQYGTKLFLCDTKEILTQLFYQILIYKFQTFDSYKFSTGMPIKELATIGLDLPEVGWTPEDGNKSELAEKVVERFDATSRAMLLDYFSMEIDEVGNICSIPVLLENYMPDPKALPTYVIRLATDVDWNSEKEFFDSFSKETARFYAQVPKELDQDGKHWSWVMEHVLYPAIKKYLIPPNTFIENGAILEIANLPNLYKVFERC